MYGKIGILFRKLGKSGNANAILGEWALHAPVAACLKMGGNNAGTSFPPFSVSSYLSSSFTCAILFANFSHCSFYIRIFFLSLSLSKKVR